VWIFLWVLVSLFIFAVFAWSVRILFKQKAAWKAFAQKMNLTYTQPKGLLVSAVVTGSLGPYDFGLFSEPQPTEDSRGQRYTTILEFGLRQGFPMGGGIGTARMQAFLQTLAMSQSVSVQDKDWDSSWIIRTENSAMLEKYLTPVRVDLLKKIFRMKVLAALFVFNDQNSVLRIETSDPLDNLERLEKIVKGVMGQLAVLVPTQEEIDTIKAVGV
jgi:hypothetical protein